MGATGGDTCDVSDPTHQWRQILTSGLVNHEKGLLYFLYQLHAMGNMQEVEQVLAPGGAMETFEKAREEGKVRYLGFSAHSADAAVALMDRYSFDSVLFPINYVCYAQGNFGPQVVAKAKQK
ncbi:MAG: hypothetical protein QF574_11045, partial [Arenicellales bacterium]|nr:hypothetical protein [Arenicellales bacterium]